MLAGQSPEFNRSLGPGHQVERDQARGWDKMIQEFAPSFALILLPNVFGDCREFK
jgi:hypothetical protein